MLGGIRVHASREFRCLPCVACIALDHGDLVGMGIALDIGVTCVAPQAAVNALAEGVAIHADVFAGSILQALIGMASQAVGLRHHSHGNQSDQ
jgi:hypothetical protein